MKHITLVGHKGNMGRRYASILNYLGISWHGVEFTDVREPEAKSEGIILATPTDSHTFCLPHWSSFHLPILCEKPICKNEEQLKRLMDLVDVPLQMVNQYKFYSNYQEIDKNEPTLVNYYHTGFDGLVWDCINLIGLAKREVYLRNDSPVWLIMLNGTSLDKRFIDSTYIDNIADWAVDPVDGRDYIKHAHQRVFDYEKDQSSDRNPSSALVIPAPR